MISNYPLLILAAGNSTRMGSPKGLLDVNGQSLLDYQISQFFSFGGNRVFVVVGKFSEEYQKGSALLKDKRVSLLQNDNIDLGQFYSIYMGLKEVDHCDLEGAFILPVDSPLVSQEDLISLVFSKKDTVLLKKDGKGGHPVLLRRNCYHELINNNFNTEGRLDYFIKNLPEQTVESVESETIQSTLNLNTQSDYKYFMSLL